MKLQKIVNVLAVASFAISGAVVIGGVSLYVNRDNIINSITDKALDSVLGGANPLGGGAVPDVALPSPSPQMAPDAAQEPAAAGGFGIPQ